MWKDWIRTKVTGHLSPTGPQTTTENQKAIPKTSTAGDAMSELKVMREKLADMMDRMGRLNKVDIGK